jgi:hypothetical protein
MAERRAPSFATAPTPRRDGEELELPVGVVDLVP